MRNKHLILLIMALLSSCSGNVDKHWNCGTPEGQGCSSIREADGLTSVQHDEKSLASPSYVIELQNNRGEAVKSTSYMANNKFIYTRTKEAADRVWFAPFLDRAGNQHEESYVRVIVAEPKWVVSDEID